MQKNKNVIYYMNITTAINRWQKKNYGTLSSFLRNTNLPNNISSLNNNIKRNNLVKWSSSLNTIMSNGNNNNTIMYRGTNKSFITIDNIIVNKSFISCSTSKSKSSEFGNCIIQFKIPSQIKRHLMSNTGENETLIERNTKFTNVKYISMYKNIPVYSAQLEKYTPYRIIRPRTPNLQTKLSRKLNSNNESSNFNSNQN